MDRTILKSLHLINFRNYQDYKTDFSPLTVFIGPNGVGKTNLLEAAYVLATTTSHRTTINDNLVRWGSNFAKAIGQVGQSKIELTIDLLKNKKIFAVSGLTKKMAEVPGHLPVVLFSPEQIDTITGSPQGRRRLLNMVLSQTESKYADHLITLHKVLRNRNRLLYLIKEGKSHPRELIFWDQKLLELNGLIVFARQKLVDFFNIKIKDFYHQISQSNDILKLTYAPKLKSELKLTSLENYYKQEIMAHCSLWGPHRDELSFLLGGKEVSTFASRGELRSITLALKMVELEYLRQEKQKVPLLLLDDVFSELDYVRRAQIKEIIKKTQTIATTTDKDHLSGFMKQNAQVIDLSKN